MLTDFYYLQVIEETCYLYLLCNRNMKIASKNINIAKHITFHSMRHGHISLLSQLGVSLKVVMQRVQHTNHKETFEIYNHVTEQMDKEMMSKLETVCE